MNDLALGVAAAPFANKLHAPWTLPRQIGKPYEIYFENWGAGRVARVTGEVPIEFMLSSLHILGVDSDGAGEIFAMLDLRDLRSLYTPCDLICLGQELASSFLHLERVAVLARAQQSMHISERVARYTGVNVRMFASQEHALDWLLDAGMPSACTPSMS